MIALLAIVDFIQDLAMSLPWILTLMQDYYVFLYQDRALERRLNELYDSSA